MHPHETIKIVIADDHEFFRNGFKRILTNLYSHLVEILAEASNGLELIELVKKHRPNVVLTDIHMPVIDGIKACRIIRDNYPSIAVMAFTAFEQPENISEMIEAGASGYIVKTSDKEEIINAILNVSKGIPYYCQAVTDVFVNYCLKNKHSKKEKASFSVQEIKVISLICQQYSTKEIANKLNLSIRTVEDYRHNIQEKTGARNMVGIAMHAIKNDIIKIGEL